jgi:DNA-binding NtrC family response regulator
VEERMSHILVVSNDDADLAQTLSVLSNAGYQASGASTFDAATRLLATRSPDLVITDECLGNFNGLHVIMRARARHPEVLGIVTTPVRSRGLEADARSLNVECMLKPQNPAEWVASISRALKVEPHDASSRFHGHASCLSH